MPDLRRALFAFCKGRAADLERVGATAASLPPGLVMAGAAALFLSMAIFPVLDDSCTFDEGTHLASGYVYLTRRDFRIFSDNPPLAKVLFASPLGILHSDLGGGGRAPDLHEQYGFAYAFLNGEGRDPQRLLRAARWVNLFWPLLTLGAVYAVARERHGPAGGVLSLGLAASCAPLLANGSLATPDLAATAVGFLAVVSFDRCLRNPSLLRGLAWGILLGGALGIKHSALLLLPGLAILGVASVFWSASRLLPGSGEEKPLDRCARLAGPLLAGSIAAFTALWAAYGFRYEAAPVPGAALPWDAVLSRASWMDPCIAVCREFRLLPEAYLHGIRLVEHNTTAGHATYAMGMHSTTGWWWYFPLALLVKTPLSLLLAGAGGVALILRRVWKGDAQDFLLLLPPAILFASAMSRNMNIGLRHILPVYPFLLVAAGGIVLERPRLAWAMPLLLAGSFAGAFWDAPHFLASFNAPALAAAERHEILADANLDWGQDLGRLAAYVREKRIPILKLSYFGAASPRRMGLRHLRLEGGNVYADHEPEWPEAGALEPGDMVAVSASSYVGLGLRDPDAFRRRLAGIPPVDRIGHSILIFRIPPR
jgi:hypothetical protein